MYREQLGQRAISSPIFRFFCTRQSQNSNSKTLPWVLGLNPKPLTLATGISIPQWLFEEKQSKACGNSKHMADALISY
jgi:hypothetical protein